MFKAGQKVVCVDDSSMKSRICHGMSSDLVIGEIYTINEITREGYGCILKEVFGEFMVKRFKPVQPARELNTAAIARELTLLNPAEIKTPMPVQKPVNQPSPA